MTYKAIYYGEPTESKLVAVARIDGVKVDIIFSDDDMFDFNTYNIYTHSLEIEQPAQWNEYVDCTVDLWNEFYQKLTSYILSLL